jgi:UDP-2,3-diacylglucosamine pyrophosphatase LpxH
MKFKEFLLSFETLVESSPRQKIDDGTRMVFLSDLHLGDGGERDDLAGNRDLILQTLALWYYDRGYTLVLNGDIEDVAKFRLRDIRGAWPAFFELLDGFQAGGRLRKIVGNHDLGLLREKKQAYPLIHGLTLERGEGRIFAFHGHQASRFFADYDYLSDFIVRYLAKPLRIHNTSVSSDSRHRFKAERRIYKASKRMGIISISGHTHRPLFESLSKYDSLRWAIEEQLRDYALADGAGRKRIAASVRLYRNELGRLRARERRLGLSRSLYEEKDLVIPCVFNSGCATGKNGYTAIEIEGSRIELVHWAAADRPRPYILEEALSRDDLPGTPWRRFVIREDYLDQLFARIALLGSDDDECDLIDGTGVG